MDKLYEFALCEQFEMPKSVEEFERNYDKKHPGSPGCFHNIYHLVAEDRDGNIVDEAFGVNCMTDLGFQNSFTKYSGWENYNYYMYLGQGQGDIDPTSSTLIDPITPVVTSNYTGGSYQAEHWYTKWDPVRQVNRVQFRLHVGYFDYTCWSEDKTVTEIGIATGGYDQNGLKYHAGVYNSAGERTTFVKKLNQKLTVTVYGRFMFPIKKIVNQMWEAGWHFLTRSNSWFHQSYDSYFRAFYAVISSYDKSCAWNSDWTPFLDENSGSVVNHVFAKDITRSMNIFIDGKYQHMSEIFVSSSAWMDCMAQPYFLAHKPLRASEPIPFQNDHYRAFNYMTLSMWRTYGHRNTDTTRDNYGQLPMVDIHIDSLRMYNGQTDEYDIDVPFIEPEPYLPMNIGHLRLSIREHNYIQHLQKTSWYTVYANEAPEYPITKINNISNTMYTTDEYWDSSTWEIISNVSNIPTSQGSKRFFIMIDTEFKPDTYDDRNVGYYVPHDYGRYGRQVERPTWKAKIPKFDLNNGSGEDMVFYGTRLNTSAYYYSQLWSGQVGYRDSRNASKPIQNETYGYIFQSSYLIYPDSVNPDPDIYTCQNQSNASYSGQFQGYPYKYFLAGNGRNCIEPATGYGYDYACHPCFAWNTTNGEHIAVQGNTTWSSGIRVYTISSDPSVAPTYEDFTFDEIWDNNPMWSSSNKGYVTLSYISGSRNVNTTYILEYDVAGTAANLFKLEGYHHGMCIDLTDYFCGINAGVPEHLSLDVYDMYNHTVVRTIDIPSGYTFQGMAGWKNWIYIRVDQSGAKSTFVYHIQENILESTPLDISMMIIDGSSYYSHIQRAVEANGNIESCMVMLASDRDAENQYHLLFKESDPLHPIELIRRENYETSSYVRNQNAWLGYTSDNKQLLLTFAARRCMCLDIGWALKYGKITKHLTWCDYYSDYANRYSPIYYKGYIYMMGLYFSEYREGDADNYIKQFYPYNLYVSDCRFYRQPYQLWVDMQMKGTTYTINSYMNPVRVNGNVARFQISYTNRDVDDPVVDPEEDPPA